MSLTSWFYEALTPFILLSLASSISALDCCSARKRAWHLCRHPSPHRQPLTASLYPASLPSCPLSLLFPFYVKLEVVHTHFLQWLLTLEICCFCSIGISFTRISADFPVVKLKGLALAFRIFRVSAAFLSADKPFLVGTCSFPWFPSHCILAALFSPP